MSKLAAFQRSFGAHLREPMRKARPSGVQERPMSVYIELVYNNLTSFVNACFPVARETLGERRWQALLKCFVATHVGATPYFREIPAEFLDWFQRSALKNYPAWLGDLLHYEWVELAVDTMVVQAPAYVPVADVANAGVVLNPAHMLVNYDWAVHRIGPDYRPRKSVLTSLLVYRTADDRVRFIHLNAVAARLLTLLKDSERPTAVILTELAAELGYADVAGFVAFGMETVQELQCEAVILGYRVTPAADK